MIAIIDYGMGNLRSVQKALERVGGRAVITQDPAEILRAEKVVLPGVGAMAPAVERLRELGIVDAIRQSIADGKPFLGICLGLQLLFEKSAEGGDTFGLGILPGSVEKFTALKVPHMGWNQLTIRKDGCPLLAGIAGPIHVYFCHSYYVQPRDTEVTLTTTPYGIDFVSSVWKDNLFAVQFHPEKSQAVGLVMLKNFADLP